MAQYDLPSWLQADAPSEPFKAMLAGAQAGSQIAANRNQARALNQRKYEFDVEQQRMAQLDAVRNKVVDQQLELGKIQIKNHILVQEEKIKADRAMSKVAELFGQHQLAGIAGTDASEARIWSTISNNPEFWINPGAHEFAAKMGLARQAREKASQFEDQETLRLAQLEALNTRKAAELQSKEDIAAGRSAAQIESARIAAKSKVDTALVAAEKWKDHSRFAAFKDASKAISLSIDPSTEPEKWSEAIRKAYNETLPRGEPNAWDTVPGATPAAPLPTFDWTQEGIKTRAGPEIRNDAPVRPIPQNYPSDSMIEKLPDATPATESEFEEIPVGRWYINPADGKRYRKVR